MSNIITLAFCIFTAVAIGILYIGTFQ